MMWLMFGLVVGFVVGLLVGRRHPDVADKVAVEANKAKAAGEAAVEQVKDKVG